MLADFLSEMRLRRAEHTAIQRYMKIWKHMEDMEVEFNSTDKEHSSFLHGQLP